MAKKTKQELLDSIKKIVGDNTSDEIVAFYEDFSDSFNDSDSSIQTELDKALSEVEKIKADYDNLDKQWRERYLSRFTTPSEEKPAQVQDEKAETNTPNFDVTIDDLFTDATGTE